MRNPSHKALIQRVLRGTAKGAFVVWVPLVLIAVTSLALAHWYALPEPALQNPILLRALAAQRASDPELARAPTGALRPRTWRLTHVLYGACECSSRVLSHLQMRGVIPQTSEQVVFVGRDGGTRTAALRARNFRVSAIEPSDVSELSGRGVGLGAVRAACAAMNGTLRIHSDGARGTRIEFSFPASAAAGPQTLKVAS